LAEVQKNSSVRRARGLGNERAICLDLVAIKISRRNRDHVIGARWGNASSKVRAGRVVCACSPRDKRSIRWRGHDVILSGGDGDEMGCACL